jgi:release factor glutamine methyltransferase
MDVAKATRRLRAAGCVAADAEAPELVDAAPDPGTLDAWVARREMGEPLAWIVGATTFCGVRVRIDPGVFVPRPQTEELARRAASLVSPGWRLVDLCTGSGAVAAAVTSLAPGVTAVGVEVDARAAACARHNGVSVVVGDLGGALRPGAFDVVTSVAPYVPTPEIPLLPSDVRAFEPALALDGGADGLDIVRGVVGSAARLLRPGGWLLTEIGGTQDAAVRSALETAGFVDIETWWDEDGDLRGILARR